MWNWIKPLRAWAMRNTWLSKTPGVLVRSLVHHYTSAGLSFQDQAIPWNAESLHVDAIVHCGSQWSLQPADLVLHLESGDSFEPENLHPEGAGGTYRAAYRIPVPRRSIVAQLYFRRWTLGQLTLPVLSQLQFTNSLEPAVPGVHVMLGGRYVAGQSFVATQARGLLASVVLRSPWPLTPILDQGLRLEVQDERGLLLSETPAHLSASQLALRETVVVASPQLPRKKGTKRLRWMLGKKCLCCQEIHGLSQAQFHAQLKIPDMRFYVQTAAGEKQWSRKLPAMGREDRVGPYYAIQSKNPGTAGLARVKVVATIKDSARPLVLSENLQLITDAPALVLPGTLGFESLADVAGFEIRVGRKCLGTLLTRPTPQAQFDSEGSVRHVESFEWDPKAEEDLNERLGALLNQGTMSKSDE